MKKPMLSQLFAESVAAQALVLLGDFLVGNLSGFPHLLYLPYFLPPLFFTLLYGGRASIPAWGSAAVFLGLVVFHSGQSPSLAALPGLGLGVGICLGFLGVYHLHASRQTAFSLRLRVRSREAWRQRKIIEALSRVNGELEERVSKNQESLTRIYQFVQSLGTKDSLVALGELLETTRIFAGAKRASIRRYDPGTESLVFHLGLDEALQTYDQTSIPLEGSLLGWVFRNDTLFSLRHLLGNKLLRDLDPGTQILVLPLHIHRRVWGLLTIEDMEFVKYNVYTEQILSILVSLAEPALEKIFDHEETLRTEERDPTTGLPYFGQLLRFLESEMRVRGASGQSLSLAVVEVLNSEEVLKVSHQKGPDLLLGLKTLLDPIFGTQVRWFHFRESSQLAVVVPGKDFDGISQTCLDALERISSASYGREDGVPLEVIFGYGSLGAGKTRVEELLESTEQLLAMQRL